MAYDFYAVQTLRDVDARQNAPEALFSLEEEAHAALFARPEIRADTTPLLFEAHDFVHDAFYQRDQLEALLRELDGLAGSVGGTPELGAILEQLRRGCRRALQLGRALHGVAD